MRIGRKIIFCFVMLSLCTTTVKSTTKEDPRWVFDHVEYYPDSSYEYIGGIKVYVGDTLAADNKKVKNISFGDNQLTITENSRTPITEESINVYYDLVDSGTSAMFQWTPLPTVIGINQEDFPIDVQYTYFQYERTYLKGNLVRNSENPIEKMELVYARGLFIDNSYKRQGNEDENLIPYTPPVSPLVHSLYKPAKIYSGKTITINVITNFTSFPQEDNHLVIRLHFAYIGSNSKKGESVPVTVLYHYRLEGEEKIVVNQDASKVENDEKENSVVIPFFNDNSSNKTDDNNYETDNEPYDENTDENDIGVAAGVAIGGVIATALSKTQKKKKEKDKKKSTFKMVFTKDFGDTVSGGQEVSVFARIIEITSDNKTIQRDDLTEKIKFESVENCEIVTTSIVKQYKGAVMKAYSKLDYCIVSITFKQDFSSITNNIKFNVLGEPEIIIPQEFLAFIACGKQQFDLPLILIGMDDNCDVSSAIISSSFVSSTYQDEDGVYWLRVTENGTTKGVAGAIENFPCEVTVISNDKTYRESISILRYHEGVHLKIDHLNCFYVKYNPDKEAIQEPEDGRKKVQVMPALNRITALLYTWDTETGQMRNPVCEDVALAIEDIPCDTIFKDAKGEKIEKPCEYLQFNFSFDKVEELNNEMVFTCFATNGILVAPNRGKAKLKIQVRWNNRTFTDEKEVPLLSQPYRIKTSISDINKYELEDKKMTENLMRIQHQVQNVDNFYSLRPLYYKINVMLEGYHIDFGYYLPDYYGILYLYSRYVTGELGDYQTEFDQSSTSQMLLDATHLALTSFSSSGVAIALRIGCAVQTLGTSEIYFLAVQSLGSMVDYAHKGGNSYLEAGFIGAKTAIVELALGFAIGKGIRGGILATKGMFKSGISAGLKKAATELTEETVEELLTKSKQLFTTANMSQRILSSSKTITKCLKQAENTIDDLIRTTKLANEDSISVLKEMAYIEGRKQGLIKVNNLVNAINDPTMTKEQLKKIVLSIQMDKHALHQLKESKTMISGAARATFNNTMNEIYEKATELTRRRLAKQLGVSLDDVVYVSATGNAASITGTVPFDKDLTFRVFNKLTGQFDDIAEHVVAKEYNKFFYRVSVGRTAASEQLASNFAKLADQSIVEATGKESYGKWLDFLRVVDKARQTEAFDDVDKVISAVKYKSRHFLEMAKLGVEVGEQAYKKGNLKLATEIFARSEGLVEEGIRQSTKQYQRIILPRMEARLVKGLPVNQQLIEKMTILEKIGLGTGSMAKHSGGSTGITVERARVILQQRFNTTIEDVLDETGNYIAEIN